MSELAGERRQRLAEALKGQSPEIAAAISSGDPLLRKDAVDQIATERKSKKAREDAEAFRTRWGFGANQTLDKLPSHETLLAIEAAAETPADKTFAEGLRKRYHQDKRKLDELYPEFGGGYGPDPGAVRHKGNLEAATQFSKAQAELIDQEVTDPMTGERRIVKVRRSPDQMPPQPSALGGAVAAASGGGGVGLPPTGAAPRSQLPSAAAMPSGGAIPASVLAAEASGQPFHASMSPGGQVQFGTSPPPRSALPGVSASVGGKMAPQDAESYKAARATMEAAPTFQSNIKELRQYNDQFSHGLKAAIAGGADWLGFPTKQSTAAANFTSAVEALASDLVKKYGVNPSNRDLEAIYRQLPTADKNPEARRLIIERIERLQQEALGQAERRLGVVRPTEPAAAATAPTAGKRALPNAAKEDELVRQAREENTIGRAFWENAKSLPGAIFSKSGGEAMKDQYGNIIEGAKQVVGMGDREAWAKEKARQEEKARTDPAYNQASIFHNIANPTAAIGGTATSLPKVALAAGVQGAIRPQTEAGGHLIEGALSSVGAVPGWAVSKVIPTTKLSKEVSQGGTGEQLLKEFPSVKPTGAQVTQDADAALARAIRQDQGVGLDQAAGITKDLLRGAGITTSDRVTPQVLSRRAATIGQEYEQMLPKGVKVKIDSSNQTQLNDAIREVKTVQDVMARAPSLATVHNALQGSGNAKSISMKTLHDAWKEVGEAARDNPAAAGKVREVLAGLIERGLPNKDISKFRNLNEQFGNLKDIERIFHGGRGEGVGVASGYLKPSKILEEAGVISGKDTQANRAAQLINRLGMKDVSGAGLGNIDLGRPGTWGEAAAALGAGKASGVLDSVALNADPKVKFMLEALRAASSRGPARADYEE
jgi:hypothetical protein